MHKLCNCSKQTKEAATLIKLLQLCGDLVVPDLQVLQLVMCGLVLCVSCLNLLIRELEHVYHLSKFGFLCLTRLVHALNFRACTFDLCMQFSDLLFMRMLAFLQLIDCMLQVLSQLGHIFLSVVHVHLLKLALQLSDLLIFVPESKRRIASVLSLGLIRSSNEKQVKTGYFVPELFLFIHVCTEPCVFRSEEGYGGIFFLYAQWLSVSKCFCILLPLLSLVWLRGDEKHDV